MSTDFRVFTPGAAMKATIVLSLLLACASGQSDAARTERERLFKLHLDDALEYTIYRDASRSERLEFRKEPVYVWTNPVRAAQQDGLVFIWTRRGRPEAIGTIFSSPAGGKRGVTHEFHSLALARSTSPAGECTTRSGNRRPPVSSWCRSTGPRPRRARPRIGSCR